MNKKRVPTLLVVDDDGDIRKFMRAGLEASGFTIVEASSGEEALEVCDVHEIDLALLDINLAGMSGIAVAERLRAVKKIPFIFVSGESDRETVRLAVAQGALGYFLKPLDMQRLVLTVETALVRAKDEERKAEGEKFLNEASQRGKERTYQIAVGLIMERFRMGQGESEAFLQRRAESAQIGIGDLATEIVQAAAVLSNH